MINNEKKILFIIFLLLLFLPIKEVYAQYKLTRKFDVELSTMPFNVNVTSSTINVYNRETDKLSATIANNNNYNIKGNIMFNNQKLNDFEISSNRTETISNLTLTSSMVSGLSAGQYELVVNITSPYATTIKNIKVNLIGTFVNVEKHRIQVAGTSSNPYIVHAMEDLVIFAQKVNSGTTYSGKYIKQDNSINCNLASSYYNSVDTSFGDLNGVSTDGNQILTEMTTGKGFMGIGISDTNTFKGTYVGNNKNIQNLYMKNTTAGVRVGFFGYVNNATIENLGIESGSITCAGDAGALVAYLTGTCNLTNCYNKATITNSAEGYSIGGVIGTAASSAVVTMKRCYNSGTVTNNDATAGLVGFVWASTVNLEECYNTGTISSTSTSGNNVATAGLVVKDSSTGGRITLLKCFNSGPVNGRMYVGGLISSGRGVLNISDSYNVGAVTATGSYAGGILAYKYSSATVTITNCYSAATVSASGYKGGIVGYNASGATTGITYTRAYYLNVNSVSGTYGGTATDDTTMKSANFVNSIGSNFKYNSGGYPKLTWQ